MLHNIIGVTTMRKQRTIKSNKMYATPKVQKEASKLIAFKLRHTTCNKLITRARSEGMTLSAYLRALCEASVNNASTTQLTEESFVHDLHKHLQPFLDVYGIAFGHHALNLYCAINNATKNDVMRFLKHQYNATAENKRIDGNVYRVILFTTRTANEIGQYLHYVRATKDEPAHFKLSNDFMQRDMNNAKE